MPPADGIIVRQKSRAFFQRYQPITDNPRTLLAARWPRFREAIIGNLIALDTKRIQNDLGGASAVVGAD
jgi:hypothetical protein